MSTVMFVLPHSVISVATAYVTTIVCLQLCYAECYSRALY